RGAVEARDYPAVVQRPTLALAFKPAAHLRALRVEQAEARGVPDFVGEISVRLDLVVVPARVGRADGGEDEARGVNAVLVEHVERVNAVALRLRHALAVLVEDSARDEHVVERSLPRELHARHHHARDPEEDYVARGDE